MALADHVFYLCNETHLCNAIRKHKYSDGGNGGRAGESNKKTQYTRSKIGQENTTREDRTRQNRTAQDKTGDQDKF